MIIPNKLKLGDTIGVVAPSNPIIGDNIEELERAKQNVEKSGFKVKFSKHIYSNTNGYSSTAQEKAKDINQMFQDKEIKMIWCAKGGENSNSTFEFLDYETIKQNPKIICGYSDATSLTNIITARTEIVTFNGTNFKTIATDETDYSYQEILKRFVEGKLELGKEEEYKIIQKGQAEGELIGGNLSIIKGMIAGKYKLNFRDKILFIEEFGLETSPALVNNYLYYMRQNKIFDQIKGIWIGSYENKSNIKLEKIVKDVLGRDYQQIPIIQSDNFGHIETKIVIPIGTKAKIDTNQKRKIELTEKCVK